MEEEDEKEIGRWMRWKRTGQVDVWSRECMEWVGWNAWGHMCIVTD